jgi:hypothetical protein
VLVRKILGGFVLGRSDKKRLTTRGEEKETQSGSGRKREGKEGNTIWQRQEERGKKDQGTPAPPQAPEEEKNTQSVHSPPTLSHLAGGKGGKGKIGR